jgi:hypothetical protein
MLNDADGQGGGNASDYEARETVADAEALFSKLKKRIKSDYNSKGKSLGAARRAKTSILKPANSLTRKTRRSCRTLFPMTSVNGTKRKCRDARGISEAGGRPAVPSACRPRPPLTHSRN